MLPRKLLVVDDDRLIGWALDKGLSANRYHVRVVETGRDALRAIKEEGYHLILLDIHLPDADGLELLGTIRATSPDSRVIVISADLSADNLERAVSGGAIQFLEKPFTIQTIQALLDSTLDEYPEKRRHPRFLCSFPISLDLLPSPSGADARAAGNLLANALDVTRIGIRISVDQTLSVGQKIRLAPPPAETAFAQFIPRTAEAEVLWVAPSTEGCTAGLRFSA